MPSKIDLRREPSRNKTRDALPSISNIGVVSVDTAKLGKSNIASQSLGNQSRSSALNLEVLLKETLDKYQVMPSLERTSVCTQILGIINYNIF